MAKSDFHDTYQAIPIHKYHQKQLSYEFKRRQYKFAVLSFDQASTVYVYYRLIKEFAKELITLKFDFCFTQMTRSFLRNTVLCCKSGQRCLPPRCSTTDYSPHRIHFAKDINNPKLLQYSNKNTHENNSLCIVFFRKRSNPIQPDSILLQAGDIERNPGPTNEI